VFVIEDEAHAELHGEFESIDEAIAELKRRASIPWDQEPNVAPCMSWRTCGRRYDIIEYGDGRSAEVRRMPALEISAAGLKWVPPFDIHS
jgi:hypothetical protein